MKNNDIKPIKNMHDLIIDYNFVLEHNVEDEGHKDGYYVYILGNILKTVCRRYGGVDKWFTYEPFYVGKGTKNRVYAHFQEALYLPEEKQTEKHKIIKEMFKYGLTPHIDIIGVNLNETDALKLEKSIIESIGMSVYNEGPLVNKLKGSTYHDDGFKRNRRKKGTYNKQKMTGKNNPIHKIMSDPERNELWRQRVSEGGKGKHNGKRSLEQRKNISIAVKKAFENPEIIKKISENSKRVYENNPELKTRISESVKIFLKIIQKLRN